MWSGTVAGAKQNGVVAANLCLPIVGHHLSVAGKVGAVGEIKFVQLQLDAKAARRSVQHAQAFGHDFLANAVSSDNGDAVRRAHAKTSLK
jgi:hypothetical protein